MSKLFLAALLVGSSMSMSPAFAQGKCDGEIKKAEAMMPTQKDAGKAEMAEAQLKIARELSLAKDEKGCMDAVKKANDQMN